MFFKDMLEYTPGAVLCQEDGPGQELPVAYASRQLKQYRYDLVGKKFTVYMEHKCLKSLMNMKDVSNL